MMNPPFGRVWLRDCEPVASNLDWVRRVRAKDGSWHAGAKSSLEKLMGPL